MTIAELVHPGERVLGVGIDTAVVADTARAAARFGPAYLRRVCSPAEADALPRGEHEQAVHLTRLWAAKEAATKTLAPTDLDPWPWPCLEVLGLSLEVAAVRLHGRPLERATAAGIRRLIVCEPLGQTDAAAGAEPTTVTMVALALGCRTRPMTTDEESSPS